VLGITVHGVLEDAEILSALFGRRSDYTLDAAIDGLTDAVSANLDMAYIEELVGLPVPAITRSLASPIP
jgi:hypothetical protein